METETEENFYNTDKSNSLKIIREAGFNPIGITVMICEETFIFNTDEEAIKAHEYFEKNPVKDVIQGWWYGLVDFELARQKYVLDMYEGIESDAPTIYWL
jgi:hypothetical protein